MDELAADPATRGVLLFGSQARGTARPDSDADLAIIVDGPGFVMGMAERDGQEFELVHFSEATATAYFSENRDAAADAWTSAMILYDPDGSLARVRDHVAAILARGKPPLDATRAHYLRAAAEDRFRAAAGLATSNDAAARVLLFERLLDLVGTFFDVRQIWAPPTKRRLDAIAPVSPELHSLLTRIFCSDDSTSESSAWRTSLSRWCSTRRRRVAATLAATAGAPAGHPRGSTDVPLEDSRNGAIASPCKFGGGRPVLVHRTTTTTPPPDHEPDGQASRSRTGLHCARPCDRGGTVTEVDPALAALPLWPDTVDAFYADRACSIRSDATRKTWGYTYRWIQRSHPDKAIGDFSTDDLVAFATRQTGSRSMRPA